MKQLLTAIAVAGMGLLAASGAQAQASSLLGSGDIKVGIFNPSNSDARTISANTQFSVGADYNFPGIVSSLLPSIYADYQGASKNGGHVNSFGIGVATRFGSGLVGQAVSTVTKVAPYAGVGIGVYRSDIKTSDPLNSGTKTSVGGKVFAGVTFNKWLVEANYQILASEHGINPSGIGVQVGLTF